MLKEGVGQQPHSDKFNYIEKDIWKSIHHKSKHYLKYPLPKNFLKGRALTLDSIDATKILSHEKKTKVNLIVTSPPYFNAQSYAWDNWLRLWFLDVNYRNLHRKLFNTAAKTTYLEKITDYINDFYNLLEDNSACFIIVGDVKRKGEIINTAKEIKSKLQGKNTKFHIKEIISDKIPKGRKRLNYMKNGDGIKYERILVLHKGNVKEKKVPVTFSSNEWI